MREKKKKFFSPIITTRPFMPKCYDSSSSSSSSKCSSSSSSSSSSSRDVFCKERRPACKQNTCEVKHLKYEHKKKIFHDHYLNVEQIHRYHIRKPKVKVSCETEDCSSSSSSSSCPSKKHYKRRRGSWGKSGSW